MSRLVALVLAVLAAAAVAPAGASGMPETIAFSARISDSGAVADGSYGFQFALFAEETGGKPLWQEDSITLQVNQGVVFHELGSRTPLAPVVLAQGTLYLELNVNGTTMTPRVAIRSVPFALRAQVAERVPVVDDDAPACTEALAGSIVFDRKSRRFVGCDGVAYVELSNRLPTRLRQGATADVTFPNTDGSCAAGPGSPWTDVTGMSVSFALARPGEVELSLQGSMADEGAETVGLHCPIRFVVDGEVLANAHPDWGHYLWSISGWGWHPTGSERRISLPAGNHKISVQGRSATCLTGADVTNLCKIPGVSHSQVSMTLDVLVP
jgi:hypothetical protein